MCCWYAYTETGELNGSRPPPFYRTKKKHVPCFIECHPYKGLSFITIMPAAPSAWILLQWSVSVLSCCLPLMLGGGGGGVGVLTLRGVHMSGVVISVCNVLSQRNLSLLLQSGCKHTCLTNPLGAPFVKLQAPVLPGWCSIYRLHSQDVLRLMYTLRHKKEFQFKFQQWICVWLRETLEEKKPPKNTEG